jgi:hypothetical protein
MGLDFLPDSRLQNRDKNAVMGDWIFPSGRRERIQWEAVHCANCGVLGAYAPTSQSFLFYLCGKCFRDSGPITGTMMVPDDVFNEAVAYEIRERFGHDLTLDELVNKERSGELGTALEKLARESPYTVWRTE